MIPHSKVSVNRHWKEDDEILSSDEKYNRVLKKCLALGDDPARAGRRSEPDEHDDYLEKQ